MTIAYKIKERILMAKEEYIRKMLPLTGKLNIELENK
jgi:hypothetical protein